MILFIYLISKASDLYTDDCELNNHRDIFIHKII